MLKPSSRVHKQLQDHSLKMQMPNSRNLLLLLLFFLTPSHPYPPPPPRFFILLLVNPGGCLSMMYFTDAD